MRHPPYSVSWPIEVKERTEETETPSGIRRMSYAPAAGHRWAAVRQVEEADSAGAPGPVKEGQHEVRDRLVRHPPGSVARPVEVADRVEEGSMPSGTHQTSGALIHSYRCGLGWASEEADAVREKPFRRGPRGEAPRGGASPHQLVPTPEDGTL